MQRAIERRGIPTVSVSVARDITERCLVPRALFLPFMMGHLFGVPHHEKLQLQIIESALAMLDESTLSGTIVTFPYTWARARNDMRR